MQRVRLGQGNRGGDELRTTHRRLADQIEQFGARLCPHDRFVGRTERRKHSRQALSLFVGLGFFLRAIEIIQRE